MAPAFWGLGGLMHTDAYAADTCARARTHTHALTQTGANARTHLPYTTCRHVHKETGKSVHSFKNAHKQTTMYTSRERTGIHLDKE